jgi:hypothetical protein
MLYLAQVTFGKNPPSLLGIFYIILSIAYLIFTIFWLPRTSKLNGSALKFYIQQSILKLSLKSKVKKLQQWLGLKM